MEYYFTVYPAFVIRFFYFPDTAHQLGQQPFSAYSVGKIIGSKF
jgi:hypothetical protein